MTDSASAQQRTTSETKKNTGQLDRGAIEQALRGALDAGPKAIGQQVRYVLALSQMGAAQPSPQPYTEKPLNVAQARLLALTNIAENLNDLQIKSLLKEVKQIADIEIRLRLLTRLALHIAPQNYRSLVRDLWNMTRSLPDPVVRSRTLFQIAPLLTLIHDEPAASSSLLEVVALAQSINNTEARIRSLVALAPYLPQTMCVRVLQRVLDDVDSMNNDALRANALTAITEPLPDEVAARAIDSADGIQSPSERARALTSLARHLPPTLQPRLRAAALDAISAISGEEERSEALIAFASNLEYASSRDEFPTLLSKALSVAVAFTRRPIRAKVLVALAPHLTLDLQGEALAAVHSLSSERDRAMLLADLAPTLPPEMLVASLAVAHTMREQDARVHALTILAHHVPPNARSQTLLDALAAASNLPHHFERVTALLALIDILPPQLQEQAFTNALETTRLIENENARSRALSLLGSSLPETLLGRALEQAYRLEDLQQRLNALIGIVPKLQDEERRVALNQMLDCARQMPFEYKRARALVSIAPLLPAEVIEDALLIADGLSDPYDRVNAYIALAHNIPPDRRPAIIDKTWWLIKEIEEGYDRSSALAAIAPFLASTARPELAGAAGMIIGAIMDDYDQASAISILAPLLVEDENTPVPSVPDYYLAVKEGLQIALNVPQQAIRVQLLVEAVPLWTQLADGEQRYRLWCDTVQRLITLPLPDVLLCLGALMPVVAEIAGDSALRDIARILGVR